MLEPKDLQMISALLDEKLENKLAPIREDIHELKNDIASLKYRVDRLETAVQENKDYLVQIYARQQEHITKYNLEIPPLLTAVSKNTKRLDIYAKYYYEMSQAAS